MSIQAVVEPAAGGGFVARVGAPYLCDATGATEQEAIDNLRRRVAAAKVVTLDVPNGENPWAAVAGSAKDVDPELWAAYKQAIEEYRNMVDADEDRP